MLKHSGAQADNAEAQGGGEPAVGCVDGAKAGWAALVDRLRGGSEASPAAGGEAAVPGAAEAPPSKAAAGGGTRWRSVVVIEAGTRLIFESRREEIRRTLKAMGVRVRAAQTPHAPLLDLAALVVRSASRRRPGGRRAGSTCLNSSSPLPLVGRSWSKRCSCPRARGLQARTTATTAAGASRSRGQGRRPRWQGFRRPVPPSPAAQVAAARLLGARRCPQRRRGTSRRAASAARRAGREFPRSWRRRGRHCRTPRRFTTTRCTTRTLTRGCCGSRQGRLQQGRQDAAANGEARTPRRSVFLLAFLLRRFYLFLPSSPSAASFSAAGAPPALPTSRRIVPGGAGVWGRRRVGAPARRGGDGSRHATRARPAAGGGTKRRGTADDTQ